MPTPLEIAIQTIREQQANRLKEVARTPEGINATTLPRGGMEIRNAANAAGALLSAPLTYGLSKLGLPGAAQAHREDIGTIAPALNYAYRYPKQAAERTLGGLVGYNPYGKPYSYINGAGITRDILGGVGSIAQGNLPRAGRQFSRTYQNVERATEEHPGRQVLNAWAAIPGLKAAGALYGGARETAGALGKLGTIVKTVYKAAGRPEAFPNLKADMPIFVRAGARALGKAEQHLGTAVRTAAGELTIKEPEEAEDKSKPKSISTPEEAMLAARRAERATAEEAPKAEAAKGEPTEPEPTKTVPIKPRTISDIFNNKPTGKPQIVPIIEEPTIAKPKEITNDTTTPEPVIQPVRPVGGNKVLPEVRSTKVSTPEVKSTTVSAKSTGTATPKVGEKIASVQNPHKAGTVESISTTKAGIPQYHIVNPEGEKFVISTKEGVEAKTLPSKEIPKENIEFPKTTTVKAQNIIKSILSGVKTRRTISKSVQGIKGKALLPKGSPALEASKEKEGISKAEKVQGKAENIENLRKSLEHEFQGVVKGSPKKAVEDFEKFMGGTIFDKISSGEALDESEQREFSNAIAALVQFGYIPDSEDTLVNAMEAILRKREKDNATANQS